MNRKAKREHVNNRAQGSLSSEKRSMQRASTDPASILEVFECFLQSCLVLRFVRRLVLAHEEKTRTSQRRQDASA